jgi:hypothetical protein
MSTVDVKNKKQHRLDPSRHVQRGYRPRVQIHVHMADVKKQKSNLG